MVTLITVFIQMIKVKYWRVIHGKCQPISTVIR